MPLCCDWSYPALLPVSDARAQAHAHAHSTVTRHSLQSVALVPRRMHTRIPIATSAHPPYFLHLLARLRATAHAHCHIHHPRVQVTSITDQRLTALCGFVIVALVAGGATLCARYPERRHLPMAACHTLMAAVFGIVPFLLASNLFTIVGTSKAERLLYLPSLGSCMAASIVIDLVARGIDEEEVEDGTWDSPANGGSGGSGGSGSSTEHEADSNGRATAATATADAHGRRCSCSPAGEHVATPNRTSRFRQLCALALASCLVVGWSRQCHWYIGVWSNGVALWGHAIKVQSGRPEWLRGGPSTHALTEYGLQLSWAGRNREAASALERALTQSEADLASTSWPTAGRLSVDAYAPLTIVYRLLGEVPRAIATADRGLDLIRLSSTSGGEPRAGDKTAREAARCIAARALALYLDNPAGGIEQMKLALRMSGGIDSVVLALAKQLEDHLTAQARR